MFPVLIERNGLSMKEEYITEILTYVNAQDEQLINVWLNYHESLIKLN